MISFAQVNEFLKQRYPELGIEVVCRKGYVYFIGEDGKELASLYVTPDITTTDDLCRMIATEVEHHFYG